MSPRVGLLLFGCVLPPAFSFAQSQPAAAPAAKAPTAPSVEKYAPYFMAPQTERAVLSPDGKYVAYTVHKGETLYVQIVPLDNPAARKSVAISDDFWSAEFESASTRGNREEKVTARVDYLRWITETRLVFSSNEGRVFAINADGSNAQTLATPKDIAEDTSNPGSSRLTHARLRRPRVIDTPDGPAGKILLSAQGRSIELFHADCATGKLTTVDEIHGRFRERDHLFDPQGRLRVRFYPRDRPQKYEYIPLKGRDKELDALMEPASGLSFRITPENYLHSRSIPVGFAFDPDILYFSSNVGRDTYGLYALDLRTGKRTDFKIEHPRFDIGDPDNVYWPGILVLDRHERKLAGVRFTGIKRATWWLDQELAALQVEFDKKFPTKMVEITDWNEERTRFLISITSTADPGTWYVFQRDAGRLTEFAQRAPWITPEKRNPGGAFEFDAPSGAKINGYLTMPAAKRTGKAPLIVYCREGGWGRQWPSYNAQVQAIAAMGFAVLQINHRGCEGFGTAHRLALQEEFDRAAAEDMVATIDWITARENVSPKQVAIFGIDFGGYFALRAMELFPDRFRCGVVYRPATDLAMLLRYTEEGTSMRGDVYHATFGKNARRLDEMSALKNADKLTQPVLVIRNTLREHPQTDVFRSALSRLGRKPELLDVNDEFLRGPVASAKAFEQIEGFLNVNIYRFGAEAGESKVVPDGK